MIYGNVNYVRNITDIDDKIIEASKKIIINKEITEEVTKVFIKIVNFKLLKPT